MVTARAAVVDLTRGPHSVRILNPVAGVGGIAPIVGLLIGSSCSSRTGGVSFWVVAALGADDPGHRHWVREGRSRRIGGTGVGFGAGRAAR